MCRCYHAVMQWKAPSTFLEDDVNRDTDWPPLAPPQLYEMLSLQTFSTLDSLLTECAERQKMGTECWMPVYQRCRDAVLLLLPGARSLFSFVCRLLPLSLS